MKVGVDLVGCEMWFLDMRNTLPAGPIRRKGK